jgi:septal ring factor EnvC (AmiA/AmiB activator)
VTAAGETVASPILSTLLSGATLAFLASVVQALWRRWRKGSAAGQRSAHISEVDQSFVVVAKARDELEEDNARLRADIRECEARERLLREEMERERRAYRAELEQLMRRLREAERVIAELLEEVGRRRSAVTPNEGT